MKVYRDSLPETVFFRGGTVVTGILGGGQIQPISVSMFHQVIYSQQSERDKQNDVRKTPQLSGTTVVGKSDAT